MLDEAALWVYFSVFSALVAAGFGAPIPEEVPTIWAGVWVGSNPDYGPFRWFILPVCFVGVLISDVMLYGIGRLAGYPLLEWKWVKRLLPPDKWRRTQQNFDRYGVKILLLIRWVPAIRSPMFISAGIMRLPLWRFIAADGVAAVFGHSLLFFLAFWFGDQFRKLIERAEGQVNRVLPLVILLGISALAGFLLHHFLRHPVATGDPEELPVIGEQVASKIEHQLHPDKPSTVHTDGKSKLDGLSEGMTQVETKQQG